MKRLFVIDNEGNIDLNKEWLHMVPEFSIILHRKWLCEGDADGRKKLMQRRIFSYIYLTEDFGSHLFTWTEEARHIEALKLQNLKEGDVQEEKVKAAIKKYSEYVQESSPKLKALRGMYAALERMNTYLESIDLNERDKQEKAVHTPSSITRAIKEMNAAYDALETMERRVMEELKKEGGNTIRGTASLGGKEGKRKASEWTESAGPMSSEIQKSVEKAIEEGKEIIAVPVGADFRSMGGALKRFINDEPDMETRLEAEEDEEDVP